MANYVYKQLTKSVTYLMGYLVTMVLLYISFWSTENTNKDLSNLKKEFIKVELNKLEKLKLEARNSKYWKPYTTGDALTLSRLGITQQSSLFDVADKPYPLRGEQRHVYFLKTHKSASDTVTNVFHRFGMKRNLTFMLALPMKMTLNWPHEFKNDSFRKLADGEKFDIICEHSVYTPNTFEAYLPETASFVSIVRRPYDRLKSAFKFFGVGRTINMYGRQDFREQLFEYLSSVAFYESSMRSPSLMHRKNSCFGFGYSFCVNGMSSEFGLHTGFHEDTIDQSNNATYLKAWLINLSQRFHLVMIKEYFEESMVLLRRTMGWTIRDVISLPRNVGHYVNANLDLPEEFKEDFKKYFAVDYILYDFFNQTFWRRVVAEGISFKKELDFYLETTEQIRDYCEDPPDNNESLVIPRDTKWTEGFNFSLHECTTLLNRQYNFILDRYVKDTKHERQPVATVMNRLLGC